MMKQKMNALIIGVNGQDGSYLAELLLEKGYHVTGWVPAAAPVSYENIAHLLDGDRCPRPMPIVAGDLSDQSSLMGTLEETRPDEIYNLASPSFPAGSWSAPVQAGDIAGLGVTRLLESMRRITPKARFYQASSSEIFGSPDQAPQNEQTPFHPRNPYGIAKLYAHWTVVRYRERYNLHACCGILYNHESPRRGVEFVTRKISHSAARIKLGLQKKLYLGDLDARRDWGFAGDHVRAMWAMLQHEPDDYVIGTGQTHSVREFCEQAFAYLDLDYRDYVVRDPALVRPPETSQLVADPSKARRQLGWQPTVSFEELVRMMVREDLDALL
jgi:GDPmannose 4,6-dehydratase